MTKRTSKKEKKVEHPCRFLAGLTCAHPEMEMRSEKFLDPDSKEYYTIPEREDCVACLLANVLVHMNEGKFGAGFVRMPREI